MRAEDIHTYASKYEYEKEAAIESLVPEVKARGFLTKDNLVRLGEWKSPRIRPRIAKNSEEAVIEATRTALATTDVRSSIHALTLLHGVGLPVASCVLHWFHSDPYPIIDRRALWTLNLSPTTYTLDFWFDYVNQTRTLANEWRVDMRTLDRALWKYSEVHEGED